MKKTIALILSVMMLCLLLTACGGGAAKFEFEAESAQIEGNDAGMFPMCVEEGSEEGTENTVVGITNANYEGNEIIWTINSSAADSKAVLTIRAASNAKDWANVDTSTFAPPPSMPVELADCITLYVNDIAVPISGTLPGSEGGMGYVIVELSTEISLNQGENVIVIAPTGEVEGGAWFDKIVIETSAKLEYTPIDNSELTWENQMGGMM